MKPPATLDVLASVDAVGIIAPVEVLRLILAARYGKTTLKCAEKIKDWLWFPKSRPIPIPTCVHATADEMEKLLRRHISEGTIRLRGDLKAGDPPLPIDPAHCRIGEFRAFEQTLKISVPGHRTPTYVYRNVFCVADDLMKIVSEISKNHSAAKKDVLSFGNVLTLKQASEATIRNTIISIYDEADDDDANNKRGLRPNIVQLPDAVLLRLEKQGCTASKSQIRKIGGKDFEGRRNKRGKRLT